VSDRRYRLVEPDDDGWTTDEDEAPFVIETITARELHELPEPDGTAELLGSYVRRGQRTIIVGDTGEGKTTLAGQMIRGIVAGDHMLGQVGAGEGPAVIIDLEQGIRTAKRMIRTVGLHERDDVHIAQLPDGLALDANSEHVRAVYALLERLRPVVVALDPYYKLYEELDPNEERGVVRLMRFLDRVRVEFDFALILPAHPRKDQPGRVGIRRLTIHDVAGSGALTRGAEVVLAIERGNPGYARLRVLKDRDGDLAVGQAVGLIFDREEGFRLDPREQIEQDELDERTVEIGSDGAWRTMTEWAEVLEIGKGKRCTAMLERLTADGKLEFVQGPEGRNKRAQCWRTFLPGRLEKVGGDGEKVVPGTVGCVSPPTPRLSIETVGERGETATSPVSSPPTEKVGGETDEDDVERLAELASTDLANEEYSDFESYDPEEDPF
jgi:AAA domain